MEVFRPATLLKTDSNTEVFLWNLQNFYWTTILKNISERLLLDRQQDCKKILKLKLLVNKKDSEIKERIKIPEDG